MVEIGIQTRSYCKKNKLVYIYRVAGNFSWELNFADFGFFRFCGEKNREFGFRTSLVGIAFRGIHVQYLKVTKMEAIRSFSVQSLHCLHLISSKFSNVKKVNLCWIFVGGNLFPDQ